jgi:hypothetical protein
VPPRRIDHSGITLRFCTSIESVLQHGIPALEDSAAIQNAARDFVCVRCITKGGQDSCKEDETSAQAGHVGRRMFRSNSVSVIGSLYNQIAALKGDAAMARTHDGVDEGHRIGRE